jgi:hypothetical protein
MAPPQPLACLRDLRRVGAWRFRRAEIAAFTKPAPGDFCDASALLRRVCSNIGVIGEVV